MKNPKLNRYEMAWSQADHAWMVVYAHDLREAEGKFEAGDYVLEEPEDDKTVVNPKECESLA